MKNDDPNERLAEAVAASNGDFKFLNDEMDRICEEFSITRLELENAASADVKSDVALMAFGYTIMQYNQLAEAVGELQMLAMHFDARITALEEKNNRGLIL